jgi:hypothetical protein
MTKAQRFRATMLAIAICIAVGATSPVPASAAAHRQPQWLRALELRSDALNRKYHLGRYAHIAPATRASGFDWTAAAVGSGTTVATIATLGAVVLVGRGRGRTLRAS